jgi:hypothetical protein
MHVSTNYLNKSDIWIFWGGRGNRDGCYTLAEQPNRIVFVHSESCHYVGKNVFGNKYLQHQNTFTGSLTAIWRPSWPTAGSTTSPSPCPRPSQVRIPPGADPTKIYKYLNITWTFYIFVTVNQYRLVGKVFSNHFETIFWRILVK